MCCGSLNLELLTQIRTKSTAKINIKCTIDKNVTRNCFYNKSPQWKQFSQLQWYLRLNDSTCINNSRPI